MAELFLQVLNSSISAGWLVLAVLFLRFLLKKSPKWVHVLLWGLVALRLMVPFSLESALSLIPSAQVISPEIMLDRSPNIHTGIPAMDAAVNPVIETSFAPNPAASANPLQILIPILGWNWVFGVCVMGLYTLLTYVLLRRRVCTAVRVRQDIYLSEHIPSPFVLGLFRPRIYLPYHMETQDQHHVIAHERTHIRRKDHWWKPLGFLLLSIHWFNPLMWLAYIFLCRDIELACDERVISHMNPKQRANYSQALLNCSISQRSISACPLAFGEVGVKERVRRVLRYKKPGFWVLLIALIACLALAVGFLTDPVTNPDPEMDLSRLEELKAQDIASILVSHPALSVYPGKQYSGDQLEPVLSLLHQAEGTAVEEPNLSDESIGPYFRYQIEMKDGTIHTLTNPNGSRTQVNWNGVYFEVSPQWVTELENFPFQADWGVSMVVDWATETTASLHFVSPIEDLFTGHAFSIQEYVDGNWVDLTPLTPAWAVTTETFSVSTDYFGLDWTELYGPLAPGRYRIRKHLTHASDEIRITVYGEFTLEAPEEGLSQALQQYRPREQVCVAITMTQAGITQYAVLPDQEAALEALQTALDAEQPRTNGLQGFQDLGLRVEYEKNESSYLFLTGEGRFFTTEGYVPEEAAAALYTMALETAKACGWEKAVEPEAISGIRSATLNFYQDVTVTDKTKLQWLERKLSQSEYLYGGAGCPFGSLLTLELENGLTLQLSIAGDSCGAWMSSGVYYRFASGNEEFYSLFASPVIQSLANEGFPAWEHLSAYLNWSDYANTCGPEEAFALMDSVFDYALEDPTRERIQQVLFLCQTTDGVYAEYFAAKSEQLYMANPKDFSDGCLNYAPTAVRETALTLLAGQWGKSPEDTRAILEANLPE